MAKGDTVSQYYLNNDVLQPAAGVEIVITIHGGASSVLNYTDGGVVVPVSIQPATVAAPYRLCFPIHNTHYAKMTGAAGITSGIQVK